jgi:hypothetical protein
MTGMRSLVLAARFLFASELWQRQSKSLPPKKKGEAERRTGTSDERIRFRGQCGERHGCAR